MKRENRIMDKIQQICCGNVNCYLILNGKTGILVDTGQEKYKQKILAACKPFSIHLLILTHGHVDHIQNASFLANQLHIPIAMCKADFDLIKDNTIQPLYTHGILGKIVLSASLKSFRTDKIPMFTPTIFLDDGDVLDKYGVSAKIIGLPGHTNGSIGIDVNNQALIVGDALMNIFYPMVSLLYTDKNSMLQSAQKIRQLGDRKIYFGHGKPVANRAWT